MFSKTDVKLETCTPDLATQFATMPHLPGERPLRTGRLDFLRRHLKAGTFVSPTWAVVVDKATGVRYRANGQHSSRVLSELGTGGVVAGQLDGVEYPADLLVTIEEYTSDDLERDQFMIFELFDNPQSLRTNVDVVNVHRVQFPELKNIDPKLLLTLLAGVALYEKGQPTGVFLPARERGSYLAYPDYRTFVLWAAEFATAVHGWLLRKPGVVAEMVTERKADQATAEQFWRLVFTESHPDADHETRELSRTLKDWAAKPRITQDKFRKETAKQWRRFRRIHATATPEDDTDTGQPTLLSNGPAATSAPA